MVALTSAGAPHWVFAPLVVIVYELRLEMQICTSLNWQFHYCMENDNAKDPCKKPFASGYFIINIEMTPSPVKSFLCELFSISNRLSI